MVRLCVLSFIVFSAVAQSIPAPEAKPTPKVTPQKHAGLLSTGQVVQNLVRMNLARAQALRSYSGTRTYRLVYRGFPGNRSAEMIVNVDYRSPATKAFTILSATGSKVLINKVFKKLLQSEQEALGAENLSRAALNAENYAFAIVGHEDTDNGSLYVLSVQPLTKSKFLYRGTIWVDAADFAVVRITVEPAKNPSFWTKKSDIEQVYRKVDEFWLPSYNHSLSAIRLGGRAELTISYDAYRITGTTAMISDE